MTEECPERSVTPLIRCAQAHQYHFQRDEWRSGVGVQEWNGELSTGLDRVQPAKCTQFHTADLNPPQQSSKAGSFEQ